MDVLEAIKSRKSIRAFKPDPVPEDVVRNIISQSVRSPSGTNTQPWHIYVVAGEARDNLVSKVCEEFEAGRGESYEDNDYYPASWEDHHKARRRQVGWDLYGLLGIKKGDYERTHKQHKRNYQLFDAPVGIFFFTETYLAKGSWLDCGMLIQTVMLAAREYGLDTCPQACWMRYAELIRQIVGAPEDQTLVCGMALGYADDSAAENTLVSQREALEEIAHFSGF